MEAIDSAEVGLQPRLGLEALAEQAEPADSEQAEPADLAEVV